MRARATIGSGPTLHAGEAAKEAAAALEQRELRLGFIALSDCAPLVIAKERGFFRKHGLHVRLERQASWASVRDKVNHGLLDGAQMLAPMPLASTLGLAGMTTPMVVPMSLGLGGNAITVSNELRARMSEELRGWQSDRRLAAEALHAVIRQGRRRGDVPLRFAVVHPHSSHHYQLCHWMAMAGIDPHADVVLSVIPPASMVDALARGEIDGYAVGEPWNQRAQDVGIGAPVVTSNEIWRNSPEKVLAVTAEWAEQHPATLRAMVRALLEAAEWLDRASNRLEAVHVIAGESYVDAPVATVAHSMGAPVAAAEGGDEAAAGDDVPRPVHVFHWHAATFPWVSHAMWFLTQMIRWGHIEKPLKLRAVAEQVYRPDLYRAAAEDLGWPVPEADLKPEGEHAGPWKLASAPVAIEMGADRFLDGRVFRPEDPVAYLEGFEISDMHVRLDDLAAMNP